MASPVTVHAGCLSAFEICCLGRSSSSSSNNNNKQSAASFRVNRSLSYYCSGTASDAPTPPRALLQRLKKDLPSSHQPILLPFRAMATHAPLFPCDGGGSPQLAAFLREQVIEHSAKGDGKEKATSRIMSETAAS